MHATQAREIGRGGSPSWVTCVLLLSWAAVQGQPLRVLFLGGIGNSHRSDSLNMILAPALVPFGISLHYTENPADLNRDNLAGYDALYLFDELGGKVLPPQAAEMKAFVEGGKGIVISHVGISTALHNPSIDSLFGGRFVRHGHATFTAQVLLPDHPALRGVEPFEAYDETYQHDTTNSDRVILEVRTDPRKPPEPWTWVRTQGKGRIYYCASGHGSNVWVLPAFQKKIAVALRWTAGKNTVALAESAFSIRRSRLYPAGRARLSQGVYILDGNGALPGSEGGLPWHDLRGRTLPVTPLKGIGIP